MSRALLSAIIITLSTTVIAVPIQSQAGEKVIATGPRTAPVVFVAHDYGYTGPDRVPSGMTTVEILNEGRDLHHAQLIKLMAGKTAADFVSAMKTDPVHWPEWISFVGGPNGVVPGDRATATMRLDAGGYLVLCIIPDKQGMPHVMLGMEKSFTVFPVSTVASVEPTSNVVITQRDFHFDVSRPITSGTHTIQVMNSGNQPHEAIVVKLEPGATVKDFLAAFEPGASGPPPGRPMGGIVGLDRGREGYFTTTFEPGHYAVLCFFPDQATGREHFTQGMISEFTVR
jgi:hypothetical protein